MTNTLYYLLPRLLVAMVLSLACAWQFTRLDETKAGQGQDSKAAKYLPLIGCTMLPAMILVVCVARMFDKQSDFTQWLFLDFFQLFFSLALYYAVLMVAMPFFRNRISARACASLWAIPNILYCLFYNPISQFFRSPKLVIPLSRRVLQIGASIWFIGFIAILAWKLLEHLLFRRRLIANTTPVTDPEILAVWQKVLDDSHIQNAPYHVGVCTVIQTPLSIGLFRNVTWVLLPKRAYSTQELELILRHEVIHIGREDSWLKFFFLLCCALCWFNPLLWLAARRSREDVELSCDETVLLGETAPVRKQYAELLLTTAGDERGFTTCLSASANSLRYRLKNIMQPGQRSGGALVVFAFTMAVFCTIGFAAIGYNAQTGAEGIFDGQSPAQYKLVSAGSSLYENGIPRDCAAQDSDAFLRYLSGLQLYELSRSYDYSDSREIGYYTLTAPYGKLYLTLYDHAISVTRQVNPPKENYEDTFCNVTYYLPSKTDWDFLHQSVTLLPEAPASDTEETEPLLAQPDRVFRLESGQRVPLGSDEQNALGFPALDYSAEDGNFSLHSAQPLGPVTVQLNAWDESDAQIFNYPIFSETVSFEIPDVPSRCTVTAQYEAADGQIYESEYDFLLGSTPNGCYATQN